MIKLGAYGGLLKAPVGPYKLNPSHPIASGVVALVMFHHWLPFWSHSTAQRVRAFDVYNDTFLNFVPGGNPRPFRLRNFRGVYFKEGTDYVYSSSQSAWGDRQDPLWKMFFANTTETSPLNALTVADNTSNVYYSRLGTQGLDYRASTRPLVTGQSARDWPGIIKTTGGATAWGSGPTTHYHNGIATASTSNIDWNNAGMTGLNRLAVNRLIRSSAEPGGTNWACFGYLIAKKANDADLMRQIHENPFDLFLYNKAVTYFLPYRHSNAVKAVPVY